MPRVAERNLLAANDLAVRAAVARDDKPTEYKIRDSDGLTLRVEASGKAAYYVRYSAAGKRQRLRIGARDVVPLKDARKRAKEVALAVERGEDPVAAAAARAGSPSFRKLWEDRKRRGEGRSIHTINSYEQALNQYFMDELGDVPAEELTMDRIAALLRKVQEVSNHRAHVVRCAVGSTYRWAYKRGSVRNNPTLGLGFIHSAEPRERRVKPEEIAAVWVGIDGEHGPSHAMRLVLKLALLTGQRSSTVAGARVQELELGIANPVWRIARSRMKNKKAGGHALPLVPAAAAQFREAIANNVGSAFVFPSEGKGQHLDKHSVSRAMNRLCTRIGVDDLHVHDFRKAITTWLAERGVSYDVRARIMHHATPDVTSRNYDFSMLDGPMRQALQSWADHVEHVAAGASSGETANVVPLARKA